MLPLLDELTHDDDPFLLLESTAGQGFSLCSRTWDFGPYFEALDAHPKLGVCLDTCHIFAAGHDLTGPHGMAQTLDLLVETVGEGRLKLIHANDSKDVVGAHKDRHENIGAGHIGEEPFRELMRHPATEGVPLIIETPGGKEGHAADVARLKKLRWRSDLHRGIPLGGIRFLLSTGTATRLWGLPMQHDTHTAPRTHHHGDTKSTPHGTGRSAGPWQPRPRCTASPAAPSARSSAWSSAPRSAGAMCRR